MESLALFDENGKKIDAVREGWHYKTPEERQKYIDEGYIVVSEAEIKLYTGEYGGENGTGYLRDPATGKPISAPPHVVTKEEKIFAMKNKIEVRIRILKDEMLTALLADDSDAQKSLRAEYAELTKTYAELEEAEKNAV